MTTTHPTSVLKPVWTDEHLMAIDYPGKVELVDGRICMSPTGAEHGDFGVSITTALANAVLPNRLGRIFDSGTGFWMADGDLLSPDAAFVAKGRLKILIADPKRFLRGAPDLAVEILSPRDSLQKTEAKLQQYFENGTTLAWIVDPDAQAVHVYQRGGPVRVLSAGDTLTAEPLIPGLAINVEELFAGMMDE